MHARRIAGDADVPYASMSIDRRVSRLRLSAPYASSTYGTIRYAKYARSHRRGPGDA